MIRFSPRRRGAAIVEFALVFILFLTITMGLIEFGRAVWTFTSVAQIARQTARYLVVHGSINPASSTEITEVAKKNAVGLEQSKLTVTVSYWAYQTNGTWAAGTNTRGNTVRVQVEYPFEMVTAGIVLPSKYMTLRSSSRAVVAN